jgi:hypothetical protein
MENNYNCPNDFDTDFLLVNKSKYNKIVTKQENANKNPIEELDVYKMRILEYTKQKLNNDNDIESNATLDDLFESYIKNLIFHFKQIDLEKTMEVNSEDSNSGDEFVPLNNVTSLWSKHKVIRKPG